MSVLTTRYVTVHHVKIWPEYFAGVVSGTKRFELRKDDRGYAVEDLLHQQEWDPATQTYTGSDAWFRVTYICRGPAFGLEAGHVCMSIERLAKLEGSIDTLRELYEQCWAVHGVGNQGRSVRGEARGLIGLIQREGLPLRDLDELVAVWIRERRWER